MHVDTVVIGGGQAGLAAGYHLRRRGRGAVILEAGTRIGGSWRGRWDSLRLFTPACFDGLPGLPFPAARDHFPSKDEMADYLEAYAARFDLPVELGARVQEVAHDGTRYVVTCGGDRLEAAHVVVATGANRVAWRPPFAAALDPATTQLHSSEYRNPAQLGTGSVLVVGAGNSGAEIALDLADGRDVWLSGRDVGHLPFVPGCPAYRLLAHFRVDTWYGGWVAAKRAAGGDPVVRVSQRDLADAGVVRVPRVADVRDGRAVLDDGRCLRVDHVVWATGFVQDVAWIKRPLLDPAGQLVHDRGVVRSEPGLAFLGLPRQSTVVSDLVGGVGADAQHVVDQLGP